MNDTNFHSIHEAVTELFLLKIISSFFNSQVFPVLVVNSLCKTYFNFFGHSLCFSCLAKRNCGGFPVMIEMST